MNNDSIRDKSPSTDSPRSLCYGTTRAALASGTAQIVTRVLTVVLSVATARALEPREVGILGLAVIVIGVVSMIAYYTETAAVAARDVDASEQYALASVVIRIGAIALLLASVMAAFPILSQYLFGKESGAGPLRDLLGVLTWVPILELASGYPRVLLQRRLDLNYVSLASLLQPVIFVTLAVTLLWNGYGYLGVAWASVVGAGAATVFLWWRLISQRWVKWSGWPSLVIWREISLGSSRVFLGGFGGFLGERVDNVLVSGAIGPTAMSFYSMAWNGSRTPANVFGSTIGFVLVPTLARIQNEPARVQRAIRESLRHSYLLLAPACAALFVSAPLLVSYILGAKWLPIVPCLRVMCFTAAVIPILHACNALLVGFGRAHLTGISTAVHLITLVTLMPVLARNWNLLGAAYADLTAMLIMTVTLCVTAKIATRQFQWEILSVLALPLVAASLAAVLTWSIAGYILDDFVRLLGQVTSFLVSYLLFIIVLGGKATLFDLIALLRRGLRPAAVVVQPGV